MHDRPHQQDEERVGELIRDAVRNCELLDPVRDIVADPSTTVARRIRSANVAHWIDEGRRPVGSKIGITSPAAQDQFGIEEPVYGMLFADMIEADGARLDLRRVPQLRVEAEIAFVLKSAIDTADATMIDVISAIDYALPAIELVSSRIRDWNVRLFDFIADNAAASLVVLGETPIDIRTCDLRTLSAVTTIDGSQRHCGAGGAYRGSPLQSLQWLAKTRAAEGDPLRSGELVMTGAIGPIVPATSAGSIAVQIGQLPPVRTTIA